MIRMGTIAILTVLSMACPVSAVPSPDADGIWMRGDGNARVRIAECDGKLCATNIWIKNGRQGESVGDRLVMTLKPQSSTELVGEAYDEKRKLTYSMHIDVQENTLTTRGCIIGGLICNTMTWSRMPK